MEYEPASVDYGQVRSSQNYNSHVTITNPLSVPVDLTIQASSNRITVSPAKVHLNAKQSIVVTVRLSGYEASRKPGNGAAFADFIIIKSTFFTHKVSVNYSVIVQSRSDSKSASPSRRLDQSEQSQAAIVDELMYQIRQKDDRIATLERQCGGIAAQNPEVEQMIEARLEQQRREFEEKSEKILRILRKKDDLIDDLRRQVEDQNRSLSKQQTRATTSTAQAAATVHAKEVESLRSLVVEQEDQISGLMKEFNRSKDDARDQSQQLDKARQEVVELASHLRRSQQELHQQSAERPPPSPLPEPRFEIAAEGGIATATPSRFRLPTASPSRQESDQRIVTAELRESYQARVSELESRNTTLQQLLHEQEQASAGLIEQVHSLEEAIKQGAVAAEEQHAKLEAAAKEASLKKQDKDKVTIANEWWSYVWHALDTRRSLQQEQEQHDAYQRQIKALGSLSFLPSDATELEQHLNSLKANLRAQAIELSAAKQEMIGLRLSHRKQVTTLTNQLQGLERDQARTVAALHNRRTDKEIKLAEMAATIKQLSGRSDLHAQLSAARSEVEAEKLASFHLRAEFDELRTEIMLVRKRYTAVEEQRQDLQGKLDGMEVLNSFDRLPGVDAVEAIELMAGALRHLNEEKVRLDSSLSVARKEIDHAQRQLKAMTNAVAGASRAGSVSPSSPTATTAAAAGEPEHKSIASYMPVSIAGGGDGLDDLTEVDRLLVDGNVTVTQLLKGLDLATMNRRLSSQANTIQQLQRELKELQASKLQGSSSGGSLLMNGALITIGAEELQELQNAALRLEAGRGRLEEQSLEINHLRVENGELKQRLISAEAQQQSQAKTRHSHSFVIDHHQKNQSTLPLMMDQHSSDSSILLIPSSADRVEELSKELELKEQLLRQRGAQLKVLMDSFEVLHQQQQQHESSNSGIGTDYVVQGGGSSQWAVLPLVKRVTVLTAELTAALAQQDLEASRMIEGDFNRKMMTRDLYRERAKVEQLEGNLRQQHATNEDLTLRLRESEAMRSEHETKSKLELDAMASGLRELELQLQASHLDLEEQKRLARALSDKDRDWLRQTLQLRSFASSSPSTPEQQSSFTHGNPAHSSPSAKAAIEADSNTNAVQSLLQQYLKQLSDRNGGIGLPRNSVSFSHGFQTADGPSPLSKQEQRYLQRVSDLVMAAHRAASEADQKRRMAEHQLAEKDRVAVNQQATVESLCTAVIQLRKKLSLHEKHRKDHIRSVQHMESQLIAIHRRGLIEERRRCQKLISDLHEEKRKGLQSSISASAHLQQLRVAQAQLMQLESRGSSFLQVKEQLTASTEERVKRVEESFYRFSRVELPRLVAGLPVVEEFMSDLVISTDPRSRLQQLAMTADHHNINSNSQHALASALCAAKAAQAAQDLRLVELKDQLAVQKSKVLTLEGVLLKWRDTFTAVTSQIDDREVEGYRENNAHQEYDHLHQALTASLEKERVLAQQAMELEEALVEAKGRQERAESQLRLAQGLLEQGRENEEENKAIALQQLSKLRVDLERQHAAEIRAMRDLYEGERSGLAAELRRVATATDQTDELQHDYHQGGHAERKETSLVDVFPSVIPPHHRRHSSADIQQQQESEQNYRLDYDYRQDYQERRQEQVQQVKHQQQHREEEESAAELMSGVSNSSAASRRRSSHHDGYHDEPPAATGGEVMRVTATHRRGSTGSIPTSSSSAAANAVNDVQARRSSMQSVGGGITRAQQELHDHDSDRHNSIVPPRLNSLASQQPAATTGQAQRRASLTASHAPQPEGYRNHHDSEYGYQQQVIKPQDNSTSSEEMEAAIGETIAAITQLSEASASSQDTVKQMQRDRANRANELQRRRMEEMALELHDLRRQNESLSMRLQQQQQGRPQQQYQHEEVQHIAREVSKEQRSTWPGAITLCDELSDLLSAALDRIESTLFETDDSNKRYDYDSTRTVVDSIKAGMAMAARIRLLAADHGYSPPQDHHVAAGRENHPTAHSHQQQADDDWSLTGVGGGDSSNNAIPERNLFLLRDLRQRLKEVETRFTDQLHTERSEWANERAVLLRERETAMAAAEEGRRDREDHIQSLRFQYEEALRRAEDALQTSTSTASKEIVRLEDQLQRERLEHQQRLSEAQTTIMQQRHEQHGGQGHDANQEQSKDFLQIQRMLSTTQDELERSKEALRSSSRQHNKDVEELRSNFLRFREAHEAIVRSLEEQIESSTIAHQSLAAPPANVLIPLGQQQYYGQQQVNFEEKIRSLEYRLKAKNSELEAVLTALSHDHSAPAAMAVPSQHHHLYDQDEGDDYHSQGVSGLGQQLEQQVRAVKAQMAETRLVTAEREIEALRRSLRAERGTVISLREDLQRTMTHVSPSSHISHAHHTQVGEISGLDASTMAATTVNNVPSTGEQQQQHSAASFQRDFPRDLHLPQRLAGDAEAMALLRRVNSMRRRALQEIDTLTKKLAEADKSRENKALISELKSQLSAQREENSRKAKHIATLKESRAADMNSLEQWKTEARQLDEANKRMSRQLAAKEALAKDLKNRVDELEVSLEKAERAAQGILDESQEAAANHNLGSLSAAELRTRIREYDLERARYKARLQALKDRITELEAVQAALKVHNEELAKAAEKLDAARATIARKDAAILSLKSQLEQRGRELEEAAANLNRQQVEAERRIKHLQRQFDQALRSQSELEREIALLRQRMAATVEREHLSMGIERARQVDAQINAANIRAERGGRGPTSNRLAASRPARRATNMAVSIGATSMMYDNNNDNVGGGRSQTQEQQDDFDQQIDQQEADYEEEEEEVMPEDSLQQQSQARGSAGGGVGVGRLPLEVGQAAGEVHDLLSDLGLSSSHGPLYVTAASAARPQQQPAGRLQQQQPSRQQPADLLSRLTGLSKLLPQSQALQQQQQTPSSASSGSAPRTPLELSGSHASSSSFSAPSTGGLTGAGGSSVERRLQALVEAALQSPARR